MKDRNLTPDVPCPCDIRCDYCGDSLPDDCEPGSVQDCGFCSKLCVSRAQQLEEIENMGCPMHGPPCPGCTTHEEVADAFVWLIGEVNRLRAERGVAS
jgi:hypothetical protein